LLGQPLPAPPRLIRERKSNPRQSLGEISGTLFTRCSVMEVRHAPTA